MHSAVLFVVVFLAAAVEAVEALTIVLAVGVTRGWTSALKGVGVALVALAVVVAALGPALTAIPLNALRLVVGGLLLVFGLQWLRKAVLRAGGLKALHDEDAIFLTEQKNAETAGATATGSTDRYAFRVAFMGVFLEGLEVAFIVVTFGSTEHNIPLASIAAGAACIAIAGAGVAIHRPLSRVPENALKYVVGVMLTAFGTLWSAEGAGVHWPGQDAAVVGIIAFLVAVSALSIARLRHINEANKVEPPVTLRDAQP